MIGVLAGMSAEAVQDDPAMHAIGQNSAALPCRAGPMRQRRKVDAFPGFVVRSVTVEPGRSTFGWRFLFRVGEECDQQRNLFSTGNAAIYRTDQRGDSLLRLRRTRNLRLTDERLRL